MLDNQAKFISEQLEVKIDLVRKKQGKQGGKVFLFCIEKYFIKGSTYFKDSRAGEIKKTNTKMMFVFGVEFSFNENLVTISF